MENSLCTMVLKTSLPPVLFSQNRYPLIFNEDKTGGGSGGTSTPGDGSQSGNSDEPDPNTPAGKKWKELREAKKAAEEATAKEREARLKAEAKAEAFEQLKASLSGKPKEEEQEDEEDKANAKELKIIHSGLKQLGLDPEALKKAASSLTEVQKQSRDIAIKAALRDAASKLTEEFKESVPFDLDKALAYASEKGYGVTMANADVTEVLRIAHKNLNEDALLDWRIAQKDPKKSVPKIPVSGTGEKKVSSLEDEKNLPDEPGGYRNMAHKMLDEAV
jgi:hypothetical protein